MTGLERRQSPRIRVDGFAYLNLGTSNGGSLVDVSEGGLGFRSIVPVQRNGTISVRFSDRNLRIETDSELAWTDSTHKTGGLRFTALPPASREQIRHWLIQATAPLAAGDGTTASFPRTFPAVVPVPNGVAMPSTPPASISPEIKLTAPLRGFSGGLMTGLMVSVLVVVVVLFQTYRRQVGESLIRLGEQFGATRQVQTQAEPLASQIVLPVTPTTLATPQKTLPTSQSVPVGRVATPAQAIPQLEKVAPETGRKAAEAMPPRVPPAEVAINKLPATSVTGAGKPLATPPPVAAPAVITPVNPTPINLASTTPTTSPVASLPVAASSPTTPAGPSLGPNKTAATAPIEPANSVSTQAVQTLPGTTPSVSEMYFEVGKFKDDVEAASTRDRLAQLGFPATAVQKGRLWMNSYHVMVGPYEADNEAKAARKKLSSRGFVPRAFRRGSRSLTVMSGLTLNGASMPAGDYTVSWESYISDATVKVVRGDQVVATTDGKWVKHGVRYPHDAYMYRRNSDGSQTLIEIRFAGMDQALVFGKSS
jgi:cell division protein FtsN